MQLWKFLQLPYIRYNAYVVTRDMLSEIIYHLCCCQSGFGTKVSGLVTIWQSQLNVDYMVTTPGEVGFRSAAQHLWGTTKNIPKARTEFFHMNNFSVGLQARTKTLIIILSSIIPEETEVTSNWNPALSMVNSLKPEYPDCIFARS